jgi:quercetin dioxygenase-like cupin family protein
MKRSAQLGSETSNVGRPMRWHAGSLMRLVQTGREGKGDMTGIEWVVRRGLEPPPHVHTREDEAVLVLRGTVGFSIDGREIEPQPGEWVYLPRNVQHCFQVLTPDAHLLAMYSPSGIETFFEALSEPVEGASIPAGSLSYDNLFDMEYISGVGKEFGLRFFPLGSCKAAAAAA